MENMNPKKARPAPTSEAERKAAEAAGRQMDAARGAWQATLAHCMRSLEAQAEAELVAVLDAKRKLGL